jgi:hypothetical protein
MARSFFAFLEKSFPEGIRKTTLFRGYGEPRKENFDDFVKSPSAALRFNFVVAAHL